MRRSFTVRLLPYILPALLLVTITACHKDKIVTPTNETGKYSNGFFIVNEGWYGHGTGSVSFFDYGSGTITDSIFTKENPELNFNPTTSTMEFGTVYNDKLYILTKIGGPIVVADAATLKQTGRIDAAGTNDWRAFIGIDNTKGLVSSGDGIYPLNLTSVTLGTKISSVNGEVGDMVKAGNYIFVLSANDGVDILNAADYTVAKTIPGMVVGFAVTPDGSVWAAGNTSLIQINPSTLNVTAVTVPFTVNGSWGVWHPGSITASTKDNTIFLANNGPYSGGKTIYKYTEGNAASIAAPFINIASGKELYGKGIAYNAAKDQLVVNTVQSGFGNNYAINDLDFYNVSSGALIKDVPFSGYYFPATFAFH